MIQYSSTDNDVMEILATPTDGGATVNSPCRLGEIVGISLTGTFASGTPSAGKATIFVGRGRFQCSVKGVDGSGNSAVAAGDKLYYVDADTPKISKKATGRFFGYALAAVTSGATATIEVMVNGK